MYGCNKLYCEHMGRYYAKHYKQLAAEPLAGKVDFRCLRFPGLISAVTVPSGGTSDYAPEMIHAAAQGKPYPCFVRPDTRIPFMAMPDGVEALLRLAAAPKANLAHTVYNVGAFNPSAEEIRAVVRTGLPRRGYHIPGGRETPGDRGRLAGRRRRLGGATRLGVRPALRLRARLLRVPDPDDPGAATGRSPPPGPVHPADGTGATSQISRAYSRTARSEENIPIAATLRIAIAAHALRSPNRAPARACASR